ncbi:MAG: hypothetical protein SVW57_14080, partial [Thermodesulfobacteriota bacterium]|nr:hypothetical protein [Thermodesulfobacteriota bacterium]
ILAGHIWQKGGPISGWNPAFAISIGIIMRRIRTIYLIGFNLARRLHEKCDSLTPNFLLKEVIQSWSVPKGQIHPHQVLENIIVRRKNPVNIPRTRTPQKLMTSANGIWKPH